MFERFMRQLGYVSIAEHDSDISFYRAQWIGLCEDYLKLQTHVNRLRQYAHVREIEENIETGKARKK